MGNVNFGRLATSIFRLVSEDCNLHQQCPENLKAQLMGNVNFGRLATSIFRLVSEDCYLHEQCPENLKAQLMASEGRRPTTWAA
jgi:hypothetical protein